LHDYVLFDYVTGYVQKRPPLTEPAEFAVTDEDFEAFKAYAKEKNFSYDRQSEKALKNLKDLATFEGYFDEQDTTTFAALEARLTPDIERDFNRFKDRIKEVMNSEIVKRYFYERGELIQNLKGDLCVEKAIEVLNTSGLVNQTLHDAPSETAFIGSHK
jgi:carboxyl-terminal processing protease